MRILDKRIWSCHIYGREKCLYAGKDQGQGKGELATYSGHADTDRELPTMQTVNAHLSTLNHVSKFRDHAVHQLQPPKAVCSPLCFFKVCDFFLFVCFLHGNIVTAFFLFSVVL